MYYITSSKDCSCFELLLQSRADMKKYMGILFHSVDVLNRYDESVVDPGTATFLPLTGTQMTNSGR